MSLRIVRAAGLVTVQDFGRIGQMQIGLAHGGALVREWLARANRRVGNSDADAGIEVMGVLTVAADAPVTVATNREPKRLLRTGEEFTVASRHARVAYLAVRGGVNVPVVLGSRSTQLSAGIGVLLRTGAVIEPGGTGMWPATGDVVPAVSDAADEDDGEGLVRVAVIPGPELDMFDPDAIERLTSVHWIVSPQSSRVGTRLEGPPLPRHGTGEGTRPMVCGAIEVPADGMPIVLGPEHPTTGGYPVVAVVAHADLDTFFAVGIGRQVRFVAVDPPAGTPTSV
jgi:biotin-dependent carboxylase-like uncharacterized protein